MNKGKLFVISGQSGVGKNTILKKILVNHPEFHRVVTFTTRDPRPNEIPGEDHFFVYPEKFKEMIENNEFIEYAKVHDEMYGTPKEQVEEVLNAGRNAIMEIDVQGTMQVKKILPEAVLIFIKYEEGDLEQSIRHRIKNDQERGETTEEEIRCRIVSAQKEAEYEKYYDHVVTNPEGKPDEAVKEIEKIIGGQK
ncbi:MAG: Guanylate kinase [Berkelbacteria bacterium GW2011_GWB1_38_5]|uniref:Guanylate kinase n=2 Tax=Candidatus Berkelbacteria TaxID=1618330 RepID=A0A0G0FH12_9BACT|nr:MAG: Guanylate kinase [Berkelbacteria bacterium GW2011_GWA1_36_9]KKQ72434.1 MAG: Guanylate kinase [Berkelbacteria bacterium GW2011_GWB1_38_5]